MSRQDRFSWFSGQHRQTRRLKSASRAPGRGFAQGRRLHVEALEDRRMLAVITVDSLLDNTFPDGGVTLREAVQAANTNLAVGDAPAGDAGADTILFDAALSGQTITLGGADLDITEALTIDATALAENVTIDANNASRIFNITAATGDFTLAGLTLTGGKTIGDNVNFSDTTFSGGAVRSHTTGSLTIDHSTVSNNSTTGTNASGGGIRSRGAITITSSTVSGNSTAGQSAYGGGIHSKGPVTLTSSTVSGNSTAGFFASGGGIRSFGASMLTNSTVSGNSTTGGFGRGGGMMTFGDTTLVSSTVTDNHAYASDAYGGGIWNNNDPVTITNSIVAGNTAGGGMNDIRPGTPPLASLNINYSLIGTGVVPDVGTSGNNVVTNNPMLGALADNGGPTATHALLAGSLAIDAGDPSIVFNPAELDQRGAPFARVYDDLIALGSGIDMGAFELQPPFPAQGLVVDTVSDLFDGDFTIGNLALREAIYWANLDPTANTVTFDASVFATPQTILLSSGEFEISEAVTIDGPGQHLLTIDAQQQSRIFNITATTGDFTLAGLTLTGGRTIVDSTLGRGGAIRSTTDGNLAIIQSTIIENSTLGFDSRGGGISSFVGTLTLSSSIVSGNSTAGRFANGGGISSNGDVTLTSSTISGNSTAESASGGGILSTGNITLTSSTVSENYASGSGGGIFAAGASGNITLTNSTVSGNSTTGSGGGMNAQRDVTLINSTVSGNRAGDGEVGGGFVASGNVTLTNSTVSENYASEKGGGFFSGGTVMLTSSTVSGNSTVRIHATGGGIFARGAVTLMNSTISGNRTTGRLAGGGGIWSDGDVMLTHSTVSDNSTMGGGDANGGGIASSRGNITLTHSTVNGNSAVSDFSSGGGIWNYDGSITITNSIIAGNSAGGGMDDINPRAGSFNVDFSLIQQTGLTFTGSDNIIGQPANLGPLADNGGPTQTHALLAGSSAFDAGDPSILFDPAEFDQRGAPFVRVINGDGVAGARIDIGAYEGQSVVELILVDTLVDENDGDFTAGDLSLREAVAIANGTVGANAISFDATLFASPQTILLSLGEIEITEAVTIDATALANNVTIDGNNASRIFNITATTGNFTLAGLTLTGGKTIGDNVNSSDTTFSGGAVRSLTTGSLTIYQSTVSENSTTGTSASGGGIRSRGAITITSSTVSGNSTAGQSAYGGGIHSKGPVTLTSSTVSGNSTAGFFASGGGIRSFGASMLTNSTVSGNSTTGGFGRGGGMITFGDTTLVSSTVTDNHAYASNAYGGGIWNNNDPVTITNSIVAGNTAGGGMNDIRPGTPPLASLNINFSLIGTGVVPDAGTSGNNKVTNNPQLGPLVDNGGPTETHALLAGSPAIDAGDPTILFDANEFDQRGARFVRVFGSRIDIGAVEDQPIAASADFDTDGDIDGADFLAWQRGFGTASPTHSEGDADNDNDVDATDLGIWQTNYGGGTLLIAAATSGPSPMASAALIDAVMAVELYRNFDAEESAMVDEGAAFAEIYADHAFAAEAITPAGVFADYSERLDANSSESEEAENPWLADEMLERVFG